MTRSKKIFAGFAIAFFILLAYASYDISSRTTFRGSKSQLRERLKRNYLSRDTAANDIVPPQTDSLSYK